MFRKARGVNVSTQGKDEEIGSAANMRTRLVVLIVTLGCAAVALATLAALTDEYDNVLLAGMVLAGVAMMICFSEASTDHRVMVVVSQVGQLTRRTDDVERAIDEMRVAWAREAYTEGWIDGAARRPPQDPRALVTMISRPRTRDGG
jgi:hypothetical protein